MLLQLIVGLLLLREGAHAVHAGVHGASREASGLCLKAYGPFHLLNKDYSNKSLHNHTYVMAGVVPLPRDVKNRLDLFMAIPEEHYVKEDEDYPFIGKFYTQVFEWDGRRKTVAPRGTSVCCIAD